MRFTHARLWRRVRALFPPQQPDPMRATLCKTTLLLAATLSVMASAVLAPVLPSIETAFADTPHAPLLTRMVLSMPALFIVLGAPLAGRLADRWGRRPVLLWGFVLYAIGGASGGLLDSLPHILIGRAILGLGVGAIMTASITLVADYFQGEERSRLLGLQQAFSHGGAIFLQLASGALAVISWRLPFFTYLISVLLLALAFYVVDEPTRHAPADAGGPAPHGPRALTWVIYATGMVVMGCFYVTPVQLAFYLRELAGANALAAGAAISWMSFCATCGALAYARIKPFLGHARVLVLMCALMAVGYFIVGAAPSYAVALGGLAVLGSGFGLLLPNLAAWLTDIAPLARRGRAVGGLTLAVFLGQFISPLVTQPLIERTSYAAVFVDVGGAMLVLGVVFLLAGPWLRGKQAEHAAAT